LNPSASVRTKPTESAKTATNQQLSRQNDDTSEAVNSPDSSTKRHLSGTNSVHQGAGGRISELVSAWPDLSQNLKSAILEVAVISTAGSLDDRLALLLGSWDRLRERERGHIISIIEQENTR